MIGPSMSSRPLVTFVQTFGSGVKTEARAQDAAGTRTWLAAKVGQYGYRRDLTIPQDVFTRLLIQTFSASDESIPRRL